MKKNLQDIIAASVCKFNIGVDIDGKLVPRISTESCEEECSFCRMTAEYICSQIKELEDELEQPAKGIH